MDTLKVVDIQWDVDIEDALEKLDEMRADKAAEDLGIPYETYANMTTDERHDFAYDLFHRSQAALEEFMGLPNEIEIPDPNNPEWDEETISNYISDDVTGFCHNGFVLEIDGVREDEVTD